MTNFYDIKKGNAMLKIIIVDDERKTIEGIRQCLDWSLFNIEVVGHARNGRDGLKLASQVLPDIVLTDIKMPIMDGIEFSRELKRCHPHIKVIFISGYSDVEYMKSAFKEGVIDFILKPIDIVELESVIKKTSELCESEQKIQKEKDAMERKIRESIPLLQNQFFSSLVADEITQREVIQDRMELLGIQLPEEGLYIVLNVDIDDYPSQLLKETSYQKRRISANVLALLRENLHDRGVCFELAEGNFVILVYLSNVNTDQQAIEVDALAVTMQKSINDQLGLSVTIGIGECVSVIEKVSLSYYRAKYAVNQKLHLGKNQIIYADQTWTVQEQEMVLSYKTYEQVYMSLKDGNIEKAIDLINQVFIEMSQSTSLDYSVVQSVCLQFTTVIQRINSEFSGEAIADAYTTIQELFQLETIEDMKEFLLHNCRKVHELLAAKQERNTSKAVEQIKAMICNRYSESLTVDQIAKEVFLSPAYACLLFKKETGETINNYLTTVRIEKAKELLRIERSKLYEVCLDVGYSDPKYFSKLFKKVTGLSPSVYK
jgi:two-component system response regulator YesN